MIVYHVTSLAKLKEYLKIGFIMPPVGAWTDIKEAKRFSLTTGRLIILRLWFPDDAPKMEGHMGKAVYIDVPYPINMWLSSSGKIEAYFSRLATSS